MKNSLINLLGKMSLIKPVLINTFVYLILSISYFLIINNSSLPLPLVKQGSLVAYPKISLATNQILIKQALLLNENDETIKDITTIVKNKDNKWKKVNDGQIIRVSFEEPLDHFKDITLYARSINNEEASVQIYIKDTDTLVGVIGNIQEENKYQTNLIALNQTIDTFDLRIQGNLEIDLITDPYY